MMDLGIGNIRECGGWPGMILIWIHFHFHLPWVRDFLSSRILQLVGARLEGVVQGGGLLEPLRQTSL